MTPPRLTSSRQPLRLLQDRVATGLITAGGVGVLLAILAIGIFLVWETLPLLAIGDTLALAKLSPLGLILAPWVERHLASALLMIVWLPLSAALAGCLWQLAKTRLRRRLPLSWAGVWLVPWLALMVTIVLWLAPWVEQQWLGGDLRQLLDERFGMDYATRNALIVGIAMGFAVIPSIYSLAEDALADVPTTLIEGAQALGASRWQALWKVALAAAGPGVFSAVMIGAGRAVGETMIVLMASGNTAVFSASPFEGMRSMAAAIAIELPEASPGGLTYHLLILAALVLFIFTFLVNTLAEVVRQRLRRRYRQMGGTS